MILPSITRRELYVKFQCGEKADSHREKCGEKAPSPKKGNKDKTKKNRGRRGKESNNQLKKSHRLL